jgi:hypothetical protein
VVVCSKARYLLQGLLSRQPRACCPVMDHPEPLEPPIGLGQEQGFEDAAAWIRMTASLCFLWFKNSKTSFRR